MAATTTSPWNKPGAWALDAEEHETELQKQQEQQNSQPSAAAEFPSLAAAAKQPKKKKNQTLSLAEFASYTTAKPTYEPKGLTHEDLLNLPTGPRQRSAEELDRSRLGGGFRSYGFDSRNGEDSSNSRWGSGGGNSRGFTRDAAREVAPSRADEIDDWSKTKKSTVGNGYERRERGSFFESHSKADESGSWVSNKPTETRRFGSSNSGFERRGTFDSLSRDRNVYNNSSGPSDSDNWARKKEESDGTGAIGVRPRLVLQPRTLPVTESNENAAKPKGSSLFGDARPREEVLAEKGKDWKELDEKLESLMVNNSGKESERDGRSDTAPFGWRSPGSRRDERRWRKSDNVDCSSRPLSAEKTEDGHAVEDQTANENGSTEGN
uniref:Eukaryotic translation initiation factor 4B3-like n=1 Tax=Rhizophora mucronata TaxID=61149 RepID=A0A2P2J537_RHIMU